MEIEWKWNGNKMKWNENELTMEWQLDGKWKGMTIKWKCKTKKSVIVIKNCHFLQHV